MGASGLTATGTGAPRKLLSKAMAEGSNLKSSGERVRARYTGIPQPSINQLIIPAIRCQVRRGKAAVQVASNNQDSAPELSRRFLVAARITMSVVGIVYIYSFWKILDFTWGLDPPWTGTLLSWGLIAVLVLRAWGLGGWLLDRALSIVHLWGSYRLFANCHPYCTVNEELYLMLAFWCCFVQLNPPRDSRCPAWCPVLLGINLGIYFCTAGFDKWQDPLWSQGEGFARFLALDWIRHPSANWLLQHHRLLRFMNWAALGMELSVLPLMLYWRTRIVACAGFLAFFASLIWPFRMDMIGPVGISMVLLVLSGSIWGVRMQMSGLAWIMAFYVGVAGVEVLTPFLSSRLLPDDISYALRTNASGFHAGTWRWLTGNITFMVPKQLFSSQHLTNLWAFRIVVERADGSTVEPVRVFNPDRTAGPDTQRWGCTRHFQACMYGITGGEVYGAARQTMDLLLRYAMRQGRGISAKLLVTPLGTDRVQWKEIYAYHAPLPPPFPWNRFAIFVFASVALGATIVLFKVGLYRGWIQRIAFVRIL